MTNADRFRSLTDEELAEFLSWAVSSIDAPEEVWKAHESGMRYKGAWLKWLKMPAKKK